MIDLLIQILMIAFFVVVGIQLIYFLFIFTATAFYKEESETPTKLPGVSVVVAAWNELENLRALLPILESQQYPDFEVIVIDDRSTDDTYDFLLIEGEQFSRLRFIRIDKTPPHISAKKYALTLALKSSQKEVILVTDADCRPTSHEWIRLMASKLIPGKDIVLGFSPYYQFPGFLNRFIRFETFYTAVQYISLALQGSPYMGVGRNLMYRKNLFFKNKGFFSHKDIIGGDDDLFMNEVATSENTAVCLNPHAFTYSMPKKTFDEWYLQKRRHLSVGKHYKFKNKLILGILSLTHILSWVLFGVVALTAPEQIILTASVFGVRLLVEWIVLGLANGKLGHTIHWVALPFFDFLYFIYYSVIGIITLFSKRTIRWR